MIPTVASDDHQAKRRLVVLAEISVAVRVLAAVLVAASTVSAQPALPVLTAPVNDFANIIDENSERELDRRIRALERASGDTVVVATVPALEGFATINELALRMFENHGRGIGRKGKDNGVLIVVAVEERQLRIEVGYDLEEFITDGFAGETIREVIRPEFRRQQYGRGLLAGATRIINRIAERRGVQLEEVPRPQPAPAAPGVNLFPLVILLWIILMAIGRRRRRTRYGRWGHGPWSGWNSGVGPFGGSTGGFGGGFGGFGGGGGFGGFGGGRSGGGGASGSW